MLVIASVINNALVKIKQCLEQVKMIDLWVLSHQLE
jgi:hypothetical protein